MQKAKVKVFWSNISYKKAYKMEHNMVYQVSIFPIRRGVSVPPRTSIGYHLPLSCNKVNVMSKGGVIFGKFVRWCILSRVFRFDWVPVSQRPNA